MTGIDSRVLVEEIIWSGIEDYALFYEIIWALNSKYPEVASDEKKKNASYWVNRLLDENCITIIKLDESELHEVGAIDRAATNLEQDSSIWVFDDKSYDRTVRYVTTVIGTGLVQLNAFRDEVLSRVYREDTHPNQL